MRRAKNIVVGSSLESLLFSFRNNFHHIFHSPIHIQNFTKKCPTKVRKEFNVEGCKSLYRNLLFSMSMSGKLIKTQTPVLKKEFNNTLEIFSNANRKISIHFNDILFFDQILDKKYEVYDYFDIRSMKPTEIRHIEDGGTFVRDIHFYDSPRAGSSWPDLLSISDMTEEELLSPDYGPGIVKIKVLRTLKKNEITGVFATEVKGKRYYKKPRLQFYKRISQPKIKTLHTLEEIISMEQKWEAWKTYQTLMNREEI